MANEHEHTWLPSVHRHRWCGECLYKEMRVDIGCEIWLPVLYGDALVDLQVDRDVLRRTLSDVMPVARAGLVGLDRIGNDGVYQRVENAQLLLDSMLKASQVPQE